MNIFNLNLRTKSMLALIVACLVALTPMIFIGRQVLETSKAHFGRAYAENFTLLRAQKIKEPVSRELALAHRFADSVLLRRWLKDPDSKSRRASFFRVADGYQEAFQGGNYFVVNWPTIITARTKITAKSPATIWTRTSLTISGFSAPYKTLIRTPSMSTRMCI
jgi:hypothetical protein